MCVGVGVGGGGGGWLLLIYIMMKVSLRENYENSEDLPVASR